MGLFLHLHKKKNKKIENSNRGQSHWRQANHHIDLKKYFKGYLCLFLYTTLYATFK